jgi:hypothetical protein
MVGLALIFLVSFTEPSMAGLAVVSTARVELTDADRLLIEENPVLRDLSDVSPELLRQALDLIAEARATTPEKRGGLTALDPSEVQLLDQNPVLREIWQSSPEASEDLLQLLKSAGGGGKSQK